MTEPAEPRLITYADGNSPGVFVEKSADVAELRGAPDDFRAFIGTTIQQVLDDSSCTDGAVGVSVKAVRSDGFASGGVNDCGGYAALWAVVDGSWKEIEGAQELWDCAVLERFKVPSDIAGDACYDYDGDNKQHDYQQG